MQFVITLLLIQFLRKSMKGTEVALRWKKEAITLMIICGLFFIAKNAFQHYPFIETIGNGMLVFIFYLLWSRPEFAEHRNTLIMATPIVGALLLQNLFRLVIPNVARTYDGIFEGLKLLSLLWLLGSWLTFRKQKKALDEERRKRREEEEKAMQAALMNHMLEKLVAERTSELQTQKNQLEETLHELKDTQALLIQSEKMASLGELTAGIAHEIQNPLNFVTNFSEINAELLNEASEAFEKQDLEELKHILQDVKVNQEKINLHGKRADAIVKGMLMHSRGTSTNTEPTDINDLADEYLRLAYHSIRAKDKNFNVALETSFDKTLPMLDIVPQDVGRVLLNMITNAFHTMNEKKLETDNDEYQPVLSVKTQQEANSVIITIQDNGKGIPADLISKVFQPFFTTKPTGHGTGLGLSISYDIVKAHGGDIQFSSTENEGTKFQISLPK